MDAKELLEFMHSLERRGLITKSSDEFDYEWVIWDYLKLRQPPVSGSVCTCTKSRETPMINGKYICSICNKPIVKTDLRTSALRSGGILKTNLST
jgi:hypothetical protein